MARAAAGGNLPPAAVSGGLSLIFWSLVIVVTVKYVILIMRADNNGEGGVLALAAWRIVAGMGAGQDHHRTYRRCWDWRCSLATAC